MAGRVRAANSLKFYVGQSPRVRQNSFHVHMKTVTLEDGESAKVNICQRFAKASLGKALIALTKCCNNCLKRVIFGINILRKLVLASPSNFVQSIFNVLPRWWHRLVIWENLPSSIFCVVLNGGYDIQICCVQNNISLSYDYFTPIANVG